MLNFHEKYASHVVVLIFGLMTGIIAGSLYESEQRAQARIAIEKMEWQFELEKMKEEATVFMPILREMNKNK